MATIVTSLHGAMCTCKYILVVAAYSTLTHAHQVEANSEEDKKPYSWKYTKATTELARSVRERSKNW